MYCDLHTHSVFSDGTWTPTQIVEAAKQQNLIVALTDHNTVSGLPEFIAAGEQYSHPVVPGVEMTTDWEGTELHLLGLFIPEKSMAEFGAFCQEQCARKEQSNQDMVERLRKASYEIDYEAIKRATPTGNINRSHIASALLAKNYVTSVDEAFKKILDESFGFYQPVPRLPILTAIRILRDLEILPVLAHPLENLSPASLRTLLPVAIKEGLRGMETFYSAYTEEKHQTAQEIAGEFALAESGGSDFHGRTKPTFFLGVGTGNLRIPEEIYHTLAAM